MKRIAILGVLVLIAMLVMPAVSAAPDLTVTSVDVNPGNTRDSIVRVYVNGSNDITAVVHNNGPDDVPGDFDVCFEADGAKINCTTVTGGLTAGTNTTVSITWTPNCMDYPVMPGFPPQSLPLTINVTADCDCANCPSCPDGSCGTYTETDETNNTYSKVIPAIQVYSTYNVIGGVVNNGYKSKNFDCNIAEEPLNQFKYYDLADGGMEYSVSGEKISTFAPDDISTRVHHIDLPDGAVVKDARLYVYWYDAWGNYKTYPTGCLADLAVNFEGTDLTPDAVYQDSKAFGYYQSPKGSSVFDVTSLVSGSDDYTAIVKNVEPIGGNTTTLLGEMLVVIYDSPCPSAMVPKVQIWMLEGTDYLMAADDAHNSYDYSVSPEEATATVAFGGSIDLATVGTARLVTVVAQGQSPGSDMLFNGNVIKTDAWDSPTEVSGKIDVEDVSVKSDLLASGNNMGFRDTGTGGMQAQNAFLIVEETPNATVYFEPSDIRVPEYCNTETVGVWINSTAALASGTIIFDYTFCCANVTDFAKDPVSFPGLSGEIITATLTPGRVKIDFATGLLDGFPANIPVRIGNMTIHCCNPSDFCMTDLTWNCTDPEVNLMDAGDVAITPVKYEDGTFACNIPDLDVIELNPIGIGDTHYTVNCTIKNVGAASAGASYANLKVNDIEVATTLVPALAVDEETVCSFAPEIELTGGDADELMVCADYNDTVVELDETNNCKGAPYPGGVEIAIEFSPSHNITVAPGDEFTVNVTVEPRPGVGVYGVEYMLSFTPGVIFAEWQVEGDFLKQGGASTNFYIGEIDNVAGTLRFAVTRTDVEDGATDKGVLARIGFTALEQGVCTGLNFTLVKVSDPEAEKIELEPDDIIDGWICTTNNSCPVPDAKSAFTHNNVGEIYISKAYFDGSASYDPEGGIITYYRWAFGDGQYGTGETIDHIYDSWKWNTTATPNCYDQFVVRLTVEDDGTPILDNATEILVNVYIAGDANGDGEVDIFDATTVGLEWDEECTSGSWDTDPTGRKDKADLNNDCVVDIFDAVIVGANWDHTAWV